jgi:hypothetical protein
MVRLYNSIRTEQALFFSVFNETPCMASLRSNNSYLSRIGRMIFRPYPITHFYMCPARRTMDVSTITSHLSSLISHLSYPVLRWANIYSLLYPSFNFKVRRYFLKKQKLARRVLARALLLFRQRISTTCSFYS